MKKIALLFMVIIISAVFAISASAATEGYYTYEVESGEATITDVDTSISGDVSVPLTLGGYSVTKIDSYAFSSCNNLKSVIISESVTTIGSHAFYGCNLTSVTIPNSVTIIGSGAFYWCDSLTNITIPASVNVIGDYAFSHNKNLASIIVDENNPNFSSDELGVLFNKQKTELLGYPTGNKMAVYSIPSSVISIGNYAFLHSENLKSVTISDSVTTIGNSAFYSCDNLEYIIIPQSVTTIGKESFYSCESLITITIPDSVTSIGDRAFTGCENLTNISIPKSVTTIDSWTFSDCVSLTSVTIPKSVNNIYNGAFNNCNRLADIYYEGSENQWKNISVGSNNTPLSNADIHYSVETGKCGENAFYTIYNDGKLIISGTGAIEDYTDRWPAPWDEMGVVDVHIASGITRIGEQAFSGCLDMKYISIPDTVKEIGKEAFAACRGLDVFYISNSVTLIEEGAFAFCKLKGFSVETGNTNYICDEAGALYSIGTNELIQFPTESSLEYYKIKEGTVSVLYGAFGGADNLKLVDCPDSLKRIEKRAFSSCENLTSILLSDGLEDIGDSAFAYCENLLSIEFPESLKSIGRESFNGCINLSGTIEVPSVDSYAFQNCKKIQKIIFRGSVISEYSFHMCSNLETVVLSDKLKIVDICAFMFSGSIENVYYCGTEEQWKKITFYGGSGDNLEKANLHYNCCLQSENYQHIYTSTVTKEATHLTEGVRTLSCHCGNSYDEPIVKLEGHTYVSAITKEATHLEEGTLTYICVCGDSYDEPIAQITEHSYKETIIDPTCSEKGYSEFKCECGDTYVADYVDANGHSFTNYISDGKATCITEGKLIAKCDNCDATDSVLEKGGHKFSEAFTIDVDPSCTNEGVKSRHCLYCTEVADTTPIGKLAHTYSTIVIDPTCTQNGHIAYTCVCGNNYTETIPAKGHNLNGSTCIDCEYDKTEACTCNCHKTGIMGIIWKIINIFNKLLKRNLVCSCGVNHY